MSGYQTLFKKEYENYLYPFFWQHGEAHEVLEEYVDKIYESGMKALCVEARPHPNFIQDQWWSDMDCILSKCKEHNMKMWILDDSHFPTGFANGRIVKDYPQYLKLYINCRRYDVQGPFTQARIDLSHLKGRPWDKPEKDITVLGVYMAKRINEETEEGLPIDSSTIVDITANMRMSDRLLTVDIPAGAYSIFVVFETWKGAEDATKDYLNPLVKEATQVLIDEVYEPHYAHYKDEFGKTIQGFFSDEPRFGNAKGPNCPIGIDMPLPWRKGLELELPFETKYLPLLWTKSEGYDGQVRFEYMDVITRLYNENFTKVMGDWCKERGVWYLGHTIEDNGAHARLGYGTGHYFRGQEDMACAGIDVIGGQVVPGMPYHHDAYSTGGSNGEFYHFALAKLGASAAHLDEKKGGRLMCESFGAYGWNEGLKEMKWIADSIMSRGVNFIVPHAFDPNPFPDWDCPPHFYAHGHNPQFRYFPTLDNYLNRVMSIFRDGKQPASVGVFYPAETEWAGEYMPIEKVCRKLCENQISFDIISRDFIKKAQIKANHYIINGNEFKAFILPYGKSIPADMVSVLYKMIQNNIKVIFIQTTPSVVMGEYNNEEWKYVVEKSSKCSLLKVADACSEYKNLELEDNEKYLVAGEYVKDGKYICMLFNESLADDIDTTISFKTKGNIYRYDAFEDEVYKVTSNRLHLTPYESVIYVVCDEQLDVKEEVILQNETEISLPEKWEVSYADSLSYPTFEKVNCDSLSFIHTIDGYEDKCGTVKYTSNIEINEVKKTIVDLGNAHEVAQVFINGKCVGTRICMPYSFDVTDYIQQGTNEISIEVTNTVGAQIRGGLDQYIPICPFGIEGPVKVIQGK